MKIFSFDLETLLRTCTISNFDLIDCETGGMHPVLHETWSIRKEYMVILNLLNVCDTDWKNYI